MRHHHYCIPTITITWVPGNHATINITGKSICICSNLVNVMTGHTSGPFVWKVIMMVMMSPQLSKLLTYARLSLCVQAEATLNVQA